MREASSDGIEGGIMTSVPVPTDALRNIHEEYCQKLTQSR